MKLARILMLLLGSLLYSYGSTEELRPTYINLNDPGAMERLKATNPSHYGRIRKILAGLDNRPEGEVKKWIRVSFKAEDVSYAPILLVTYPPQRDLAFTLDGTRYTGRVTLEAGKAEMYPVKHQ